MSKNGIWLAILLVAGAWNPFLREVPEIKSANEKLKAKDYPTAEEAYKKALETRASNAKLRHNLGLAFLAQNNYAAAESEFVATTASDSAIVRSRGNFFLGIVRFHLAETLQEPEQKIAKYKESADNFRRVLETDPDDEDARWNLEMALERIEDVEREKEEKQKQQEEQEKQQQQEQQNQNQEQQQQQQEQQNQNQEQQQQQQEQQNQNQEQQQQQQEQQNQNQEQQQQQQEQQNQNQEQQQQQQEQQNQNQEQQQQQQEQQNQNQEQQQQQQKPQAEPSQPDSPEVRAARRALQDLKERQKQRILEMHRKGGQGRRAPIKDW